MSEHDLRERIAEALRRHRYGLVRPLWRDLSDNARALWRRRADAYLAVARRAGLALTEK